MKAIDPVVRFWEKVDVGEPDECWLWKTAAVKGYGYGVFYDGTKTVGANRFALSLKLGRPLEPGERARHTCDSPPCCNPAHLIVGTQADNMRDKSERGRHHNQQKTHCPQGHKYDRIIKRKGGGTQRGCYTCHREEWHRNKKVAA